MGPTGNGIHTDAESFMRLWLVLGVAFTVSLIILFLLPRVPPGLWAVPAVGIATSILAIGLNFVLYIVIPLSV